MLVLEPGVVITAIGVVFFASLVRSTFGFGDALIGMPLLAMTVGLRTATPLVALVACTIGLTILLRSWRRVHLAGAWRLILSTLAGIPVGLYLLNGVPESFMQLVLGMLLLAFSGYNLTQPRVLTLATERSSYAFGFAAGVLGGAYNTNGPPVVLYGTLRRWSPATFRATLQGYFFSTGVFIALGHAMAGLWTRPVLGLYLGCLPAVALAILIGGRWNRRLDPERFARYIYVLLLLVALVLFVETIRGMAGA